MCNLTLLAIELAELQPPMFDLHPMRGRQLFMCTYLIVQVGFALAAWGYFFIRYRL